MFVLLTGKGFVSRRKGMRNHLKKEGHISAFTGAWSHISSTACQMKKDLKNFF